MVRPIIAILVAFLTFNSATALAQQEQQNASFKNFNSFRQLVPGIDFFASKRQDVAPYEKPLAEAVSKLQSVLGTNLPQGAIFICSTLAQEDSVYEPKVLRSGYSWTFSVSTPQVRMQKNMANMKQQMAGQVSPEMFEQLKRRMSGGEMNAQAERQMAADMIQKTAYAILQTSSDKELQYRSSRLLDVGKSPLPDWLDIGIASYASGAMSNLSYLQQHIDETFPIDDVLTMSRPFVASAVQGGNGGGMGGGMPSGGFGGMSGGMPSGGMPSGGFGGMGGGMPSGGMPSGGMPSGGFGGMGGGMPSGGMPSGGFGGMGGMPGGEGGGRNGASAGAGRGGGQRGGMQRTIPKDEQDRMLFDGQASTFFCYLIEKVGIDKVKEMIKEVKQGKNSRDYLVQASLFGNNFEKVEQEWTGWVKTQQAPPGMRGPGMF